MKKIFTKRLFLYMLAAFLVTVTAIFIRSEERRVGKEC